MQKTFDVEIQFIKPLLQANVQSFEVESNVNKGKRKTSGIKDCPNEWKAFLYRTADGKLGHPGLAIESLMQQAAREFKADKRRTLKDVVKTIVSVPDEYIIILDKNEPDSIRRDIVVNPNTKGRGFCYRPQFEAGTRASFTLVLEDDEIMEADKLNEILVFGGARIGIGSWRPKFGRFMVTKFQERK